MLIQLNITMSYFRHYSTGLYHLKEGVLVQSCDDRQYSKCKVDVDALLTRFRLGSYRVALLLLYFQVENRSRQCRFPRSSCSFSFLLNSSSSGLRLLNCIEEFDNWRMKEEHA